MARSSAILVSMCRFCSSNPRMAAVMISVVSFVGMSAFRTIHVNAIFPVRSVAAFGGEFLENLALNLVTKPHPNDGPGRMLIWDGPLQGTWLLQHPSVGLPIPAQLCSARAHPGLSSQGHIMVVCTTRSVQPVSLLTRPGPLRSSDLAHLRGQFCQLIRSLSVFAAKREQSLTTVRRERSRRERDSLAQLRCRPTGGATTPQELWSWFSFHRTVLVLKPDLSTHGRCRASGGMRPGPLLGLGDFLLFPPFHRSTKTVRLCSGLDDVRTVRHSIQQRLA